MTIQIKHAFTSLKGDGGDATLIRPSNWNALHSTSMATQMLIGRLTAGAGAFEEIPLTTYMASLLASADYTTLAAALGLFETGDVKLTLRTAASGAGWVKLVGGNLQANTIGSAGSGAVLRANSDTLPLYTIIWDACTNTEAPIYDSGGSATSRGANAAADFSANKRLAIPNPVGKAIMGAGAANSAGLITSARALGVQVGAETHTLAIGEIPAHNHGVTDPGHTHALTNGGSLVNTSPIQQLFGASLGGVVNVTVNSAVTGISIQNNGGGGAHNNMQPSIAYNVLVKL